ESSSNGKSSTFLYRSSSMPLRDQEDVCKISTSAPHQISTASSPYQISTGGLVNDSSDHASSDNGSVSGVLAGDRRNSIAYSTWTSPASTYVSSPTMAYSTHPVNATNTAYTFSAVTAPAFNQKQQCPAMLLGLDSLLQAAELCPPLPQLHNHRSTGIQMAGKKRSISQSSYGSMLDTLAMVATAEISLSKRQALASKRRDSGNPECRIALERECERLLIGLPCD
ncbi:hypothetical protein GGI11_004223, partial [Coemansia sp. RSA 2049]